MNLEIARVVATSDSGCDVQPVAGGMAYSTCYSKPITKYNIPVRPAQFVIVDLDTTPPETIFRFSRARVTQVTGPALALEDHGHRFAVTQRASYFDASPQVGDEVVLIGWNDENRRVVDIVVDDKPAHPERLGANWFPVMEDSVARASA